MPAPSDSLSTPPDSFDRALLLASIPNLSTPHFLSPVISSVATATRRRLVIVLFSRFFNASPNTPENVGSAFGQGVSHTEHWHDVQSLLTFVYVQATAVAQVMGKILMEIDVLLKGMDDGVQEELGDGMDITFRVTGNSIAVPLPPSITSLRQKYLPYHSPADETWTEPFPSDTSSAVQTPSAFPVVALGGTFDHLHAGHKILLSMAEWITSQKVIVGVTDDALLQNKTNKHLIQPLSTRISRVLDFLRLFKPGLIYDVVPINDVYGPTGWDPNIHALVVSKETLGGAAAIASHRASHALPSLQTFVIDVIAHDSYRLDHEDVDTLKRAKMSSTFIREWIATNGNKLEE